MRENIKSILSLRKYKAGYHIIEYVVDGFHYGADDVTMKSAFTNDNLEYIGTSKWAYRLTHKYGLTKLQSATHPHNSRKIKKIDEKAKDLLLGDFLSDYSFFPVNIGFSEKEQKWYGWSHRAIFGFGIGSKVEPGHVAYRPYDKEDFIRDSIRFWTEEYHRDVYYAHDIDEMGQPAALIKWIYSNDVPNKDLRGKEGSAVALYPEEWGRGTWIATSLLDAKQMAIDFADGVS